MGVAFEKANHQYVEFGNRNNLTNYSNHIMASEVEAVPVPDEEVATGPDGEPDRKTSVGSGEIQLSKIQIILRPRSDDEEEEDCRRKTRTHTSRSPNKDTGSSSQTHKRTEGKGASKAEERGDPTNGAGSKRKDGGNGGAKSHSSLLN